VQRLARLLLGRYQATDVYILQLPQTANGPKIGVDDYLAAGHTIQELETHQTSLGTVTSSARVPLCSHPETGAKLFLPAGYDVQAQTTAHLPDPGAWVGALLDQWAAMLTAGHDDTDPATDAWEALVTMLAQGRKRDDSVFDEAAHVTTPASWEWIEADRGGGSALPRDGKPDSRAQAPRSR